MYSSFLRTCLYISFISDRLAHAHERIDLNNPNQSPLYPTSANLSDIQIDQNDLFSTQGTFAHLPRVDCFSDSKDSASLPAYDIAFLGAPFDTAVSARPGARYGPSGIREGSYRIGPDFSYDIITGYNAFKSWAKIVDCGSVPMTPFDNNYALLQLEKAHRIVAGRSVATKGRGEVPRIVMLGGDHTVTLPALRAAHERWGKVSVIHFDSHVDTWDPKVLGGGISDYSAVNHGTFLHIAHEEGLISNTSIHAGIRAPASRRHGDLRNDMRCGFDLLHARSIDQIGVKGIIKRLRERVGTSKVYITVDIDVLDPAFAPATGTPEVAGWTTRELLSILEGLDGLHVIGADVVEVAPAYDNAGQTTVLAAAEVALTLMSLMVGRKE